MVSTKNRTIILFGVILLFIVSCKNNSKAEKTIQDSEKELVDFNLRFDAEKINLISHIQRINVDTTRLILRDYLINTPSVALMLDTTGNVCEKALERVCEKYKISAGKASRLIFMYKYNEMPIEDYEEGYRYEEDNSWDRY